MDRKSIVARVWVAVRYNSVAIDYWAWITEFYRDRSLYLGQTDKEVDMIMLEKEVHTIRVA
jgi:hypothetical protein